MYFKDEYEFLSNMYLCKIEYNGHVFDSSEHAYQCSKTVNVDDFFRLKNIQNPHKVKTESRNILKRDDWDLIKVDIMEEIVRIKFQIPELKQKLITTGKIEIVELNWWGDDFWGVYDKTMKGKNILGKLLMKIREEIKPRNSIF